jgi:predicted nucleic acid-binding protein
MPGYLADTCVIIDLINNRGNRREFIWNLLQPGDTLGYCTINLIEVYTGMRPGEERVTDMFFERLLYYEVVQDIAKQAGSLRFHWRQRGQTLSLADATIAAVALRHGLTLLTGNGKHFPMADLALLPV